MRRWRQLSPFSKTDLKKINIFIILLFCAAFLQALDQEVNITVLKNGININISVKNLDRSLLVNTLKDGLRCGITFEIQLFKKIRAIADKFISSTVITREGKWDPFSKSYLISQNEEFFQYTHSINDFFNVFLDLENLDIPFEKSDDSQYYILCRVRVETLKLVPPFQILAPGMGLYFPSTSWEKYVIM